MPLKAGATLGPYEIDAPLGAGGIGEVYRARDTRLDRTVAIKVLPEHVAADPDLKQRFEREAKAIAALNHPHICTLHDIGTEGGTDFLVMEYLDGRTLAQRLENGALPLEEALQVAIAIADALDKAHRQGIVHRDLKPGNIMLTKTGAKLLDFGLAKLKKAGGVGVEGLTAQVTQSEPLTSQGSILGTLQYMAPEQLDGRNVDARSDVFAFGAVVYEMVTGRKAFESTSQASLIGAILHTVPPRLSAVQPTAPPPLDRLVAKCLAKDPDRRWQTASDLVDELRWLSEAPAAGPTGAAQPGPAQRRPRGAPRLHSPRSPSSKVGKPAPCGPRTETPSPSPRGRRTQTPFRSTCAIWIRRCPGRSPTWTSTPFPSNRPRPAGSCLDPPKSREDCGRSRRWAASRSHTGGHPGHCFGLPRRHGRGVVSPGRRWGIQPVGQLTAWRGADAV